ncbi:hypothetical protein BLNAU_13168 [Blattamonas nauphoetae]|uniref:Uncharacterized protein n=1 Tax=Blattamonas nauphoetae TaxID=2049346 RepID=A0ABQ9XIS1_9EUKA|nr:hypothetical protein BLNAU_13168 [Blattamonas nauphoetae]
MPLETVDSGSTPSDADLSPIVSIDQLTPEQILEVQTYLKDYDKYLVEYQKYLDDWNNYCVSYHHFFGEYPNPNVSEEEASIPKTDKPLQPQYSTEQTLLYVPKQPSSEAIPKSADTGQGLIFTILHKKTPTGNATLELAEKAVRGTYPYAEIVKKPSIDSKIICEVQLTFADGKTCNSKVWVREHDIQHHFMGNPKEVMMEISQNMKEAVSSLRAVDMSPEAEAEYNTLLQLLQDH